MNKKIESKIADLLEQFSQLSSWEDKYKLVMDLGKSLNQLTESEKEEKFKIKGCQSQVWLVPNFENGALHFKADSDSILVRGIIALLVNVYSGESPKDILDNPPEYLEKIGLTQHLSLNRSNGLRSMIKQIQMYAFTFQSMQGISR